MSLRHIAAGALAALLLVAGHFSAASAAEAPLADAAESKHATAIRALLDKKSDVNARQADGMTALHWAAYHDDLDLVKRFLAAGADAKAKSRYDVTPLALACTNGNGEIVAALLAAGADANSTLQGGETALMTASRTG